VFLITKSGFGHVISAESSILAEVTIMLDYYFKANPAIKVLP